MEYGVLGNGDRMPKVGFGTWNVRGRAGVRTIIEALEEGYRLIDTAHMYANEREVGEALRKSGVLREDAFVTTKLDRPYAGYDKALAGCDHSLRELGLDYVDLLLIHEPYAQVRDMWRALVELREQGKAGHIGVSNFQGRFLTDFLAWCDAEGLPQPELDQIEAHVYWMQTQTRAVLEQRGILVQVWLPSRRGAGASSLIPRSWGWGSATVRPPHRLPCATCSSWAWPWCQSRRIASAWQKTSMSLTSSSMRKTWHVSDSWTRGAHSLAGTRLILRDWT